MAEVCKSPFDGDSSYDINVEEEVDVQIYLGSLALYLDEEPGIEPFQTQPKYSNFNQDVSTLQPNGDGYDNANFVDESLA